jgi:hypothetical protein
MWSSLVASRSGGYPMLSHDPGECPHEMDNQGRMPHLPGTKLGRFNRVRPPAVHGDRRSDG